ncbi:MAG: type II toxin-antitoxin system VapC family toxin [Treponema bryantii]|nr:type II toxin-antitoxin system VapC family toxin [Treponema bryantii]
MGELIMDILLDTHLLLWALGDSEYLPESVKTIINDEKTNLYYSTISMWEVAIKHKKGKLKISGTELFHYCEQAGFKELVLNEKHIIALETIEKIEETPPHNDPFDKILLAQAKGDGMLLLTHDKCFSYYDEPYYRIV